MNIALLRVGVDAGSGGMQGPLFRDGSFEFVPIPDTRGRGFQTSGNTRGRYGRPLVDYFPAPRRQKIRDMPIHCDPEFETFTYGDPTRPKSGLGRLLPGDFLVFYCGLQGWDFESPPALYLLGYFDVCRVVNAADIPDDVLQTDFFRNHHVLHRDDTDWPKLVLVKGGSGSRLLRKAVKISCMGRDRRGRPLKLLSPEMRSIFGEFGGSNSIQRSTPRWVPQDLVQTAAEYVRSLD